MPIEKRARLKDIEGNPHCRGCNGKGYNYITIQGVRDLHVCGCAKARKVTAKVVEEAVT